MSQTLERELDIAALTRQVKETNAAEVAAFGALIAQLEAASVTTAKFDFRALIEAAQQLLRLDDLEMSRILKVSRPTIGRWIRGSSVPHPLARKAICDVLAATARAQSKAIRA